MAATKNESEIILDVKITLTLNYYEAQALSQMIKYGSKAFLEGYYKQLGKSYMQPYENGVKSLFQSIRDNLPSKIKEVDTLVDYVKTRSHSNIKIK